MLHFLTCASCLRQPCPNLGEDASGNKQTEQNMPPWRLEAATGNTPNEGTRSKNDTNEQKVSKKTITSRTNRLAVKQKPDRASFISQYYQKNTTASHSKQPHGFAVRVSYETGSTFQSAWHFGTLSAVSSLLPLTLVSLRLTPLPFTFIGADAWRCLPKSTTS